MSRAADAPLRTAEPLRCPACLAVHQPGQGYCLECGASLNAPAVPRARPASGALDPLVLAIGVIVLLAGALGLSWAVGSGEDSAVVPFVPTAAVTPAATGTATDGLGGASGPTGTNAVPGSTDAGTTGAAPSGTSPDPAGTATDPTGTAADPAGRDADPAGTDDGTTGTDEATGDGTGAVEPADDWPAGRTGWAVILISEETGEHSRAEMETLRAAAESKGLTDVGLLLADNYRSLNAGYRVLYQGPFDTRAAASDAALAAKERGYPFAYPRRVAP